MEPLVLKPRAPAQRPEVEEWNDDDFDNIDDMQFRAASTATSVVSHSQTNLRESASSRLSMRSDSNNGDEHWDVLVDEQASIKDAVTLAKSKGIPLPTNVPRSALEGGTIRRLGGKVIKRAIADDWSEDLDLTENPGQLKLAKPEDRDLSESLRQISAAFRSSPKTPEAKDFFDTLRSPKSRPAPTPVSLEQFRDVEEDDCFGEMPTIRVAKHRSSHKQFIHPPSKSVSKPGMEDIEEDFQLPADGQLTLSNKNISPRTPQLADEIDFEWAEGSLGTRHAGIRRGGKSNRSSSASAMSPSVSSAFTVESEDEGLDGLVLPQGPVNFNDILKKKQEHEKETQPSDHPEQRTDVNLRIARDTEAEEWLEDIVIPEGRVFDEAKLTLNRNIKHKAQRSTSPAKRTTTSLNFTSTKTQGTISRLPRFAPAHDRHERVRTSLEPVSETGVPFPRYQRPGSRLGHATSSSVSAIPSPQPPSTPSTPSRREMRNAMSRPDTRYEPPTTTNAQLLRSKRSMPVMRGQSSPSKPNAYPRPPSRQDGLSSRLNIMGRPKSPFDRAESRSSVEKKSNASFLPGSGSTNQSQYGSTKLSTTRHYRRNDSDGSGESMTAAQKSLSRLAGVRPETPGKGRASYTIAELAAQAKQAINKPMRRRNFGDGSELEIFDDLPTSATSEAKFVKQPVGRGPPRSLRSKLGQGQFSASSTSLVSARSGAETPMPITPLSPIKQDFPTTALHTTNVPRFARDTAASRNAREQRQISTTFQNLRGEPLQPMTTNWKAHVAARPSPGLRSKKKAATPQKPHLIKPLGDEMNRPKEEKGMFYNAALCRWEGNENALAPFDVPDFHPPALSPSAGRGSNGKLTCGNASPTGKSNMALIMNVGGNATGVQLVGGMVFDPRQMRWLKVAEGETGHGLRMGKGGSVQLEEEEDVFAGLEDLKEESESNAPSKRDRSVSGTQGPEDDFCDSVEKEDVGHASGHSSDEWGVAEEYDVGPEFVRRQRGEEDRWRRKVEKWLRPDEEVFGNHGEETADWRWAIRELVQGSGGGVVPS